MDKISKQDIKIEKKHATLIHIQTLSLHIQEDNNKFSSKIYSQDKIFFLSQHITINASINELEKQSQHWHWNRRKITWSNNWYDTWWIQNWNKIWYHKKIQLLWHENIRYHFKQTFFFLWLTFCWFCKMDTPQFTWKIFTYITTKQTPIFHDPWRQHTS